MAEETEEILNSNGSNEIETVNYIPLIIYEKYIEITDIGIEYLKSYNNKVIKKYFLIKLLCSFYIVRNFRNN